MLLEELKAISGGGNDYIGSLSQVEILFTKIPSLNPHLKLIYNLIELTRKDSKKNQRYSYWDIDSDIGGGGDTGAQLGGPECDHGAAGTDGDGVFEAG
jgi:hypothetical protein